MAPRPRIPPSRGIHDGARVREDKRRTRANQFMAESQSAASPIAAAPIHRMVVLSTGVVTVLEVLEVFPS